MRKCRSDVFGERSRGSCSGCESASVGGLPDCRASRFVLGLPMALASRTESHLSYRQAQPICRVDSGERHRHDLQPRGSTTPVARMGRSRCGTTHRSLEKESGRYPRLICASGSVPDCYVSRVETRPRAHLARARSFRF